MKKSALLFVLTFSLFFISCSNNEVTTSNINETDLVGDWRLTDMHSENGKMSGSINGVPVSVSYSIKGKNYNINTTFKQNPNTVTSNGTITFVTEYSVLGQSHTEEANGDSPVSEGKWTLDKTTLTVKNDQGESTANIVSYDGTNLVLKQSIDRSITQGTQNLQVTGDMFITLSK